MIAIVDYGRGNLYSVKNALDYIGVASCITAQADDIARAAGVIVPGVGAFPDAMRALRASGLVDAISAAAARRPLLGICLGMQLLFDRGFEFGETQGLGLLPGTVERIQPAPGLKIPHMGWNDLTFCDSGNPLLAGLDDGAYVYFVHSYKAVTDGDLLAAVTTYGERIPALVHSGHIFGAQFHPEKSGDVGLTMLKNFGGLL